jgi:hypothetical protein
VAMDARHAGALIISKSHGRSRCAAQAGAPSKPIVDIVESLLGVSGSGRTDPLDQDYRLTITGQQHQALR